MKTISKIGLIILLFCSVALIAAPKGGRRGPRKDFDRDKRPQQRESSGKRAMLTCPSCDKRIFIRIASDLGDRNDVHGGGRGPDRDSDRGPRKGLGRNSDARDRQPPPRPPEHDGERSGGGRGRNRTELTCPNCQKSLFIFVAPDRGGRDDGRGGPRGPERPN